MVFWLRRIEANAVNYFKWDAVAAIGCPDFLCDDVVVFYTVEADVAVGDAVNVYVEPCVEVAIVAIVVECILTLLLCRCWHDVHE